jgi:hypothetical protein
MDPPGVPETASRPRGCRRQGGRPGRTPCEFAFRGRCKEGAWQRHTWRVSSGSPAGPARSSGRISRRSSIGFPGAAGIRAHTQRQRRRLRPARGPIPDPPKGITVRWPATPGQRGHRHSESLQTSHASGLAIPTLLCVRASPSCEELAADRERRGSRPPAFVRAIRARLEEDSTAASKQTRQSSVSVPLQDRREARPSGRRAIRDGFALAPTPSSTYDGMTAQERANQAAAGGESALVWEGTRGGARFAANPWLTPQSGKMPS